MKTQEAIVNGKKIEVVIELDPDEKEYVLMDEDFDDTLDLTEALQDTMEIKIDNES